ncbi:MAG: hypothetical protein U0Q12_03800 [Vicinamibacterales bacterium]
MADLGLAAAFAGGAALGRAEGVVPAAFLDCGFFGATVRFVAAVRFDAAEAVRREAGLAAVRLVVRGEVFEAGRRRPAPDVRVVARVDGLRGFDGRAAEVDFVVVRGAVRRALDAGRVVRRAARRAVGFVFGRLGLAMDRSVLVDRIFVSVVCSGA